MRRDVVIIAIVAGSLLARVRSRRIMLNDGDVMLGAGIGLAACLAIGAIF